MMFPNFAAGLVAALSISGVNAGLCRPSTRTSAVVSSGSTTAQSVSETSATATVASTTSVETGSGTTTTVGSETSAVSDTSSAETSFATTTVELTTSGIDITTDLITFITLTADTTTSELATTSAFVPADLFPCSVSSDCAAYVQLCDAVRCGCINRNCEQLTDTTTVAEATTTAAIDEPTTTAAADETTTAAVEEPTTTAAVEEPATTTGPGELEPVTTLPPLVRRAVATHLPQGELACIADKDCDKKTDIDGYSCETFDCVCVENCCVANMPGL
ncbi:hypothetical protein FBEOM_9256 [Fusarium beomiforme]|uniref:Extracellular membrane protein CFEM domain-containing protein n=1 Tax=Fusarium beomiforme TaxID=44412 RepID=A0A9P5ADM5_9HYPO|nr:hypothetical protein FBEOM_9256 [Fusarium beomiforme]